MLKASHVTQSLPGYGELILECDVYIKQGIHHRGNGLILKYACALLNSGGGLLRLCNVEHMQRTQSKHLDTWWSGMENILTSIVSSDDICNYFDLVGDYDDPDLYLFVRMAEHLCTLDYHARLPTDTATRDVTHQSALKLLASESCGVAQGQLLNLPPIPAEFRYGVTNPSLKQEGKRIQFKQLSSPKGSNPGHTTLPDRIRHMMVKYVSAFANHEGGRVYFGIEDNLAAVIGEELTEEMQQQTVKRVADRMACMIWGDLAERPERGRHWDIDFRPVIGCPRRESRVIVIVSICQFSGGVFISCPESFYVRDGSVDSLSFDHWKSLMLKSTLGEHASAQTQACLVFTLPASVSRIKDKLFQASNKPVLHPKHSMESLPSPTLREQVHVFLEMLGAAADFLAINPYSWGICLPQDPHRSVAATLLILGPLLGVHVLVLGSGTNSHLMDAARKAAVHIKQGITMNGACLEKFFAMCHAANADSPNWQSRVVGAMMNANECLPSHFRMGVWKHERVVHGLVFWMAMYKSHTTTRDLPKHYFTLTLDQFELLWLQQFMRELWVHGPAGSGKTLLAVLWMRELRRRGFQREEILYLVENEGLCDYIGSFNLALTTCRRPFLTVHQAPATFDALYSQVKNVIVDEAQNFKDRDGDWYSTAQALVTRWATAPENLTEDSPAKHPRTDCRGSESGPGYFWVFMDYAGKVHRFAAGLPGLLGKNNYMLSEVKRSTGEIFNFAQRFLDCEHEPTNRAALHVNHQLQGDKVKVIKCEDDSVKSALVSVLANLQDKGVKLDDVAVLLGKRRNSQPLQEDINQTLKERNSTKESVTVDSVKRFSGLERPVIIGLNLNINEEHADFNKFMANLVSRATEDVVIITSKDLGPVAAQ